MTDKQSTAGNDQANNAQETSPVEAEAETPDKGMKSRLTDAQKQMLESKSRGGGAGTQSVGSNHKPTHASGKLGPAPKKVRW
ncbi:hypothetical protein V3C33_20500 [Micrococcaceae bacterium Sec5.7]